MKNSVLPFLNTCPEMVRREMVRLHVSPGDLILSQGAPPEYVYLLLEGETRVYHLSRNGINSLQYIYSNGELFGEMEALNGMPLLADVRASTPCEVLRLEREVFRRWMKLDGEFSAFVSAQLADKLYQSCLASAANITYPLRYRVLYSLWKAHQQGRRYVTKEDLIAGLGSNERSVNRVLKELSEVNLVETDRGVVKIVRLEDVLREMKTYE